jgi:hypothetical protein
LDVRRWTFDVGRSFVSFIDQTGCFLAGGRTRMKLNLNGTANRRISKCGFVTLSLFYKKIEYLPSTFDIHYSLFDIYPPPVDSPFRVSFIDQTGLCFDRRPGCPPCVLSRRSHAPSVTKSEASKAKRGNLTIGVVVGGTSAD